MFDFAWLDHLMFHPSASQLIFLLSLTIAIGILIGRIRIFGISFGIAGVLFAGMVVGRVFPAPNMELMKFVREFGLILFVYAISVHVGPSFFSAFRKGGLLLNGLALLTVALGVGTAYGLSRLFHLDVPVVAGLLSGAVTNTPSLAAAQELLKEIPGSGELAGVAYAIVYPMGVTGIILSILLIRLIFRINVRAEVEEFRKIKDESAPRPQNMNVEIINPGMDGATIEKLLSFGQDRVRASRMLSGDKTIIPTATTIIKLNDIVHLVGLKDALDRVRIAAGDVSSVDLRTLPNTLTSKKILVTHKDMIGELIGSIETSYQSEVVVTRVERAGVEFVPTSGLRLQFGDTVTAVGTEAGLKKFALALGNSEKKLSEPNVIGVFVGILFGVILGTIPFHIPGLPGEIKLGLAGGPLLAGILLSRLGSLGPIHWYLPNIANLAIREIGIALFLACVGISSGGFFTSDLLSMQTVWWFISGVLITTAPLIVVGILARAVLKLNFTTIAGLLAGGMTDPPALAFVNTATESDAPTIAYASVYPLTMFLRVVSIQVLIILISR